MSGMRAVQAKFPRIKSSLETGKDGAAKPAELTIPQVMQA